MKQREIILNHLQRINDWVPAYKLRSVNTPFGWLGHQADRVCRKLAEENQIERKLIGKYANYRAKEVKYVYFKVEGSDKVIKMVDKNAK